MIKGGLESLKFAGQSDSLEIQAGVNMSVLRQNPFFKETSIMALRALTPSQGTIIEVPKYVSSNSMRSGMKMQFQRVQEE